jgi:hypothetical protein
MAKTPASKMIILIAISPAHHVQAAVHTITLTRLLSYN